MENLGIEIVNLHKKYDDVHAVQGIDLSIKKGEFYGLLGPNGAGKSTTINSITSLVKPTSGNIKILGKDIVSDFRYARSQVGIAAQELSNDWFFPLEDLLYYQAGFYGVTRKDAQQRIEYILENPPRKQVIENERIIFINQTIDSSQKNTQQLLLMIRTVRNNLFHGGKYLPDGEIEAGRNEFLVNYSLIILRNCIQINTRVYASYQH